MEFNHSIANTGALILNAGYEPLKVVSWQKALLLWIQEKVDVLEFHSAFVHSPSQSFQLPSVIRLRKYINPRFESGVRLSRQNLFLRDKYRCQYCGNYFSEKKLTIDHVHPVSRGGGNKWDNVTTACSPCNNKKGDKTPKEAKMPLLTKPYEPKWLPHKGFSKPHVEPSIPKTWLQYIKHLLKR